MYKCKHFDIQELVDPDTYNKWGEFSWNFLDNRILMLADFLRDKCGPAMINNYKWGGPLKESGLRNPVTSTGSRYSQHKFGRALDIKFEKIEAEKVRHWLKQNWTESFCKKHFGMVFSITLEENVTWLHVDVRNSDKLLNLVYP